MDIVIRVLIQVLIVIGLSRLMGLLCRRLKQPLVIGEIVAGIMLGPSLFGLIVQKARLKKEVQSLLQFPILLSLEADIFLKR